MRCCCVISEDKGRGSGMAEHLQWDPKTSASWSRECQIRAVTAPQRGEQPGITPMEWAQPHSAQKASEVWLGQRNSVGRK